ncbi:acyltransferase family protein [Kitasatospora sp. NPDC001664]
MQEVVGASGRRRLDSLTGARFLAAGLVFFCHLATSGFFVAGSAPATGLMAATKTAGTIGVSFFFVLSGFVLTWSVRPADTYGGVLRRRLVKIFPNHLLTYALAMAVYASAFTPLGTALLNLLLLQAWSSDPMVFLSVNGASWSLSCELLFYVLFPVLLPLLRRIPARRLWWWAGGVAAAVMLMPLVAALLPAGQTLPVTGSWLDGVSIERLWLVYVFPPVRLLEFALGILMARIVQSGRWIAPRPAWTGLLVVAAYVLGLYTPMLFTVAAVTVVPLALFVASLAQADSAGAGTPLAAPVMRRLGEASFAFYLIHGIVLEYAGELLVRAHRAPSTGQGVVVSLLTLVVSLALALAIHRWFETPLVRWFGRPRPRPVVPAEAGSSLGR